MPYVSEGESVILSGNWTTHPEYGEQFRVEYYEMMMPADTDAILKYLSSGIISGIREATAKKLVDKFGTDTLNIIMNEPEKISAIKGITKDKAKKISEAYRALQSVQSIIMFLQQYSISAGIAVKVHNILGAAAIEKIKENPYILADEIDGITFKTADNIASSLGFPKNTPVRIRSGIKYILRNAAYTNGHSYLPKTLLIEHAAYNLGVEEDDITNALSELLSKRDIIIDTVENTNVVYLFSFYEAENYVALRIFSLSAHEQKLSVTEKKLVETLNGIEKESDTELAPEQRDAVITAATSGCMILTGGPGTGKTTTINAIIKMMKSLGLKIALAAPTGRAAKRMSELTGLESKTIHRLLGTQMSGGFPTFTHNESNPFSADVIILDETSMIDIMLMSSFLRAMKYGSKLILAGDSDQLPSVGAGNVLHDIINSGVVPVIKLTKIFRQAEKSMIIVNAHKINAGIPPVLSVHNNDFFFLQRATPEQSAFTVVDLFKNRLPKSYGMNPITDIQVLAPMKKGITGTINLNKMLQLHVNPPADDKAEHKYGNIIFREGDKVMQIKNNYDIEFSQENGEGGLGIFNGDMGIISGINDSEKYMTIIFDEDRKVVYPYSNLGELDLAYAMTVHKSQGNEFRAVVMPLCSFIPKLMSRNLFYTAVTRAKNLVILVGSANIAEKMTLNNSFNKRFTGLGERIYKVKNSPLEKESTIGSEETKDNEEGTDLQ